MISNPLLTGAQFFLEGGGGGGGGQSNSYACLEKVESSFEIERLTLQAHYLSEGVPDDLP